MWCTLDPSEALVRKLHQHKCYYHHPRCNCMYTYMYLHLSNHYSSGAFHSLLCRRSGTSLIYCFNMERDILGFLRDAPLTPCCCGGYFLNLLPAVCDEARTQMVGRGTELPHPLRCSTSSIGNIQSMRALGGVRWRVFVAYCLMACIRSTVHDVY